MSDSVTRRIRGLEALRWYRKFYANPLSALQSAQREFGQMAVFENTIPGVRGSARYALMLNGSVSRDVLERPNDFRPTGLVLNGPPGSALRRLRHGIFQMHGNTHRRHRRMMRPSFSRSAVSAMVPTMAPLVDEIIDRWSPGGPVDMIAEMRTLSNWVAAKMLFGAEDFAASLQMGALIDQLAGLDAQRRKWGMLEIDLPGTPYRREIRHAERLEQAMLQLIAEKRRAAVKGSDVLSVLIEAADSGSGMSDADMIAHSVSLYGASFETTASALAWTLFLLAQHPKAAARLHAEVTEELGGWPPDAARLDSLPFLNAVVDESMRVLPPVPITMRRVTKPISLHGVELDIGNKIVLSQFLVHRDPNVFPNPNRFDPSRWLSFRPDPYQYIPFSVGPRVCLGAFFAVTEIKLVIARVMQKYRVSVAPNARIDTIVDFVIKPAKGLPMIVQPQDGAFRRMPVTGNILEAVDLVSPEADQSRPSGPLSAQDPRPVGESAFEAA